MPSASTLERAFRKAISRHSAPHQSRGRLVRFPGASIAAEELGVSRQHLHRVLIGERKSPDLIARWKQWLKRHPEFATITRKTA